MARPSNSEQRRREIVQALGDAMATLGYEGASVLEIGRRAGLAPGLVHYHFRNKQEILLELIETLRQSVSQRLERRVDTKASPQEKLNAFIDAHLALDEDADPKAVACWVVIAAEALRQPEVRAAYQAAVRTELDQLTMIVREALRAENRPTRNATTLAAGVYASIRGAYQLAVAAEAAPQGFAAPTVRSMAKALLESGGS